VRLIGKESINQPERGITRERGPDGCNCQLWIGNGRLHWSLNERQPGSKNLFECDHAIAATMEPFVFVMRGLAVNWLRCDEDYF